MTNGAKISKRAMRNIFFFLLKSRLTHHWTIIIMMICSKNCLNRSVCHLLGSVWHSKHSNDEREKKWVQYRCFVPVRFHLTWDTFINVWIINQNHFVHKIMCNEVFRSSVLTIRIKWFWFELNLQVYTQMPSHKNKTFCLYCYSNNFERKT